MAVDDGSGDVKRAGELAYWKGRQAEEGRFNNGWYERFYTGQFRLTNEDYAGRRVLDIGCGPRGSLEWASMASRRVGLDPLADDYLRLGASAHEMEYVASPAETMPFPDGSFDVVCAFNSLDHVDDPNAVIDEVKRVTAIGGLLLLMVDIHRRPTPQEPILLHWDVYRRFLPEFQVQFVENLEKGPAGTYVSVEAGVPYDHADPTDRYGVLTARMVRVDPGSWWPGGPRPDEDPEPNKLRSFWAGLSRWWDGRIRTR